MNRDFFHRVVVISLKRTPERLAAFWKNLPDDWPFQKPEVFEAIDGRECLLPEGWQNGHGCWGCMASWRAVLKRYIDEKPTKPLFAMEDDCNWMQTNPIDRLLDFIRRAPADAQLLYPGCQHCEAPTPVLDGIVRGTKVARTHSVIVMPGYAEQLYRELMKFDTHVDHWLAAVSGQRKFYCADPPLTYQREGKSEISRKIEPSRSWSEEHPAPDAPFAVSHSGKWGDILFSLPVVRAMSRKIGRKALFQLTDWSFLHDIRMTAASMMEMAPLLEAQPYIFRCELSHQPAKINLDWFRDYYAPITNGGRGWHPHVLLTHRHLIPFGLDVSEADTAWLTVPEPKKVAPVVIARSARYRNGFFPWQRVSDQYRKDAVFVGTTGEWNDWRSRYGDIPRYECRDILELAQVVCGSTLFIGNQSLPNAISEATKHASITEINIPDSNTFHPRPNAVAGWDDKIELPDLSSLLS